MTGQSLLDRMELLNQELQLQSGEADVTRGLLALNVAQDLFETLCAQQPNIFGSQSGTVTTTSGVEYTAYPTGLLRLDGMDYLHPTTLLPVWPLRHVNSIGGHAYSVPSFVLTAAAGGASPWGYWTNGSRIYWAPLPDGTYSIRYYGFIAASDITASGTFAYPDIVALPLAVLAGRLMKMGIDDPVTDVAALASEVIGNTIKSLVGFVRDGAESLRYTHIHDT